MEYRRILDTQNAWLKTNQNSDSLRNFTLLRFW